MEEFSKVKKFSLIKYRIKQWFKNFSLFGGSYMQMPNYFLCLVSLKDSKEYKEFIEKPVNLISVKMLISGTDKVVFRKGDKLIDAHRLQFRRHLASVGRIAMFFRNW